MTEYIADQIKCIMQKGFAYHIGEDGRTNGSDLPGAGKSCGPTVFGAVPATLKSMPR